MPSVRFPVLLFQSFIRNQRVIRAHLTPLNQKKCRVAADSAWLAEPELPRKEEVMAREPQSLPHNEVEAPPGSKARYLESQYRLLRYEGVEHLRRAVQEFHEDPDMEESKITAIYTNVGFIFCPRTRTKQFGSVFHSDSRITSLSNGFELRWLFMVITSRELEPSVASDFVLLAPASVFGGSTPSG